MLPACGISSSSSTTGSGAGTAAGTFGHSSTSAAAASTSSSTASGSGASSSRGPAASSGAAGSRSSAAATGVTGSSGGTSSASTTTGTSSGTSASSSGAATCASPTCDDITNTTCGTGTDAAGDSLDVYDNEWCCSSDCAAPYSCELHDVLTVCSEGSWTVQSSAPEGNTAVLGYVSSQINYPGTQAWSSYHTITSSYAEQSPGGASADYEAAYDLWLNNYANEVMIWVDTDQQVPGGNLIASGVTIGGATYDVYLAAATATTGTISFDATANASTGTVDILDFFQWASSTDAGSWLPTDAVLTQFNFGWEICSTGGQTLTFTLDDVSVTAD